MAVKPFLDACDDDVSIEGSRDGNPKISTSQNCTGNVRADFEEHLMALKADRGMKLSTTNPGGCDHRNATNKASTIQRANNVKP
mmetsp:Transcript_17449/g.24412  ORF Transcript_17449/g.24412 Transcript_17449/m.24412 type:complete len:84 (+) Transcript_17449:164-415(+)